MPLIRFGLQIPSFTYPGVPDSALFDRISAIARTAEDSGFDSIWVMDHFYQFFNGGPTDPMLEAYTLLGGIAARTERARLGALVTGVIYRNPALLAKMVTTLDIVSSGRAILGIGAAWKQDEHEGYGSVFPPIKERMERLEDALRICRAMFAEEAPTYEGRHYSVRSALNYPRPLQRHIPILVGGGGEQRTLRLVAQYADACNLMGDPDTIRHKLDVLEQHCDAVGRDPAEITKTRLGTLIIRETADEAKRAVSDMRTTLGLDDEQLLRQANVTGSPDEVCEQVQSYLDAGLDGLIFNMRDAQELELVQLAGETLTKRFGKAL